MAQKANRKPMKHEEDKLQAACVKWFRIQYPDVVLFAIPNGGQRNAVTGAIMKATGTLAGVADLFVMSSSISTDKAGDPYYYNGLFIEMKAGKGKQNEAQKAFEQKAQKAGYYYAVCRSLDEFMQLCNYYLSS